MNVVGKVSSFITQGVYSVATPFHPFGGAVDIIVVKQNDGTYRSTPWYVRFGKFQGVLKGAEKVVRIEVNGVEANFNMYLDNSGEAYFVREDDPDKDDNECYKDSDNGIRDDNNNSSTDYSNIDSGSKDNDFFVEENSDFNSSEVEVRDERVTLGMDRLERVESDVGRIFYDLEDSMEHYSEFNLDSIEQELVEEKSNSEVVLVSVDGHILTAPISTSGRLDDEDMQLSTPPFHLGPGEGTEEFSRSEDISTGNNNINNNLNDLDYKVTTENEEHLNNHEEESPQGSSNEEKKICIEGGSENSEKNGGGSENSDKKEGSPENMSSRLKRRDVFKSCLELTALSAKHEQESTVEIAGDDVDPNKSSLVNDERTEEGNLEISRDGENERNTFGMMDQDCADSSIQGEPVSNNEELLKQVEIDQTVGRMNNNGEEYPASDVCSNSGHVEAHSDASLEVTKSDLSSRVQISLCGKLLHPGMGSSAAEEAFNTNRISVEEFKLSASSIIKNENLILRIQGKYLKWDKASHIVLGMAAFGLDPPVGLEYAIPVEKETKEEEGEEDDEDEDEDEGSEIVGSTQSRRWRLWPIPFSRRVKTLEHSGSNSSSNEEVFVDSDSQRAVVTPKAHAVSDSPRKQIIRTNVPTTDQITSLNLKEGQNSVTFVFSTRVLGSQKVEAHIYLWKWNTRIVISDVDGTITKSDVLGQFMPLVGKDWTHSGIARLFCAIKENGYQLLFLSARAIVQSYLTKNFLFNLKQDGKSLPSGPVVISPDGLFPSLYREVIRRAPHEFKIACLEDIKALFPPDYNPFYAGFGNRDTDELSYRKIGIPKGKIFIINPKGEVAINHRIDAKSYTSLHTLVNDMFPPTSLVEQEDYNSWNYWKVPLPDID